MYTQPRVALGVITNTLLAINSSAQFVTSFRCPLAYLAAVALTLLEALSIGVSGYHPSNPERNAAFARTKTYSMTDIYIIVCTLFVGMSRADQKAADFLPSVATSFLALVVLPCIKKRSHCSVNKSVLL